MTVGYLVSSSIALLSIVLLLALLLLLHAADLLDLVLLQLGATVHLVGLGVIIRLLEIKSSLSLSSNQLHPDGDEDDQEERDSKHLLGHDGVVNLEEGKVLPGEDTGP